MSSGFHKTLEIQSHKGPYVAELRAGIFDELLSESTEKRSFIVDAKVAGLYSRQLENVLSSGRALLIEASEESKTLDRFTGYIETLAKFGTRRGDTLVAIGGGIIQDISCFIAATMFRGLEWVFYPTTLLAQADSCIGSKSSINVGEIKNLLGTFTPPRQVRVDPLVLETLGRDEIRSGVGEMLKVHLIDGPQSFESIEKNFDRIFSDREVLLEFVYRSLLIKKRIIEMDEFDQGIRNIMNYGHSFGHAIESATDFAIPHGIAVTIGMDMANFVAAEFGLTSAEHTSYFKRVHGILRKNYAGYEGFKIPLNRFIQGISKDKKNTASKLGLILPGKDALPARSFQANDDRFQLTCRRYFEGQMESV